jgi:hypothetical protein
VFFFLALLSMFDGADSSRRKQKEARRIFKRRMQMREKDGAEGEGKK